MMLLRYRYPWLARLLLLVLVVALSATTAHAEEFRWKNVTVGAGGYMPGIVFSRAENGLAYLRSDMGGCYRFDQKLKRWIPLQDDLSESSYMGIESLAPDPADANVVYAAVGMYRAEPAAIIRSEDRGATWHIVPVPFHMGGNEDGRSLGERLAIDPNDTRRLFFGSRFDGLMMSDDRGENWQKVASLPLIATGQPKSGQPCSAGLSFVLFDRSSGEPGKKSSTIFVASADRGAHHLFTSTDAGKSWKPVPGGPPASLLPLKGDIIDNGFLVVTYGDAIGPNEIKNGAVYLFDSHKAAWTDITPGERSGGGYCGVSVDRQKPGTIAVSTMDHWSPTDTVWRTTDYGKTWKDIAAGAQRDVSATPYLLWGKDQPRLGWWLSALAIDPFDSRHAVYATGATVYSSMDFDDVSTDRPTKWTIWTEGIEQTAIITLLSPTTGPHLISGFGDLGGFVHDDLDRSPPQGMFENPRFTNTDELADAGLAPDVIVRAGRADAKESPFAVSEDVGKTWQPLLPPPSPSPSGMARRRRDGAPTISVSANGKTILAGAGTALSRTTDRGKSWEPVTEISGAVTVVSDRVDPQVFYASPRESGAILVSTDGGSTFGRAEKSARPSPEQRRHASLYPIPGERGSLLLISEGKLSKSVDLGQSFNEIKTNLRVDSLSFGMAAAGSSEPTLFAIGAIGDLRAIWRSSDGGISWTRLNEARHQWGRRFRCISGDMRIFGRVYVGTDGRGIFYGDRE